MFTRKQMPAMAARHQARLLKERYYHGSPHAGCGLTLRYTSSSNCVECTRQLMRDRYIPRKKVPQANVPS